MVEELMGFLEKESYSWIAGLSPISFLLDNLSSDARFSPLLPYLDKIPGPEGDLSVLLPNIFDLDLENKDPRLVKLKQFVTGLTSYSICDNGKNLYDFDEETYIDGMYCQTQPACKKDDDQSSLIQTASKACCSKQLRLIHQEWGKVQRESFVTLTQHAFLGMSPKKQHEIMRILPIITNSIRRSGINKVVEFGCGHGYLSTSLALEPENGHVSFLGIDQSGHNCQMAIMRHAKVINAKRFHHAKDVKVSFKIFTFDQNSKLDQIGEIGGTCEHFDSMWISLHSCGNLSVSMLRKWVTEASQSSLLLQVACCYHRLDLPGNFPLSIKLSKLLLTKEILNLACQSDSELRFSRGEMLLHFYGAAFHLMLIRSGFVDHLSKIPTLGSMKQIPVNAGFNRFAQEIFSKSINAELIRSSHFTNNKFTDFASIVPEVLDDRTFKAFSLLFIVQRSLGPLYEILILTDRVYWLREQGISVAMKRVFDVKISPRSYVILCSKRSV